MTIRPLHLLTALLLVSSICAGEPARPAWLPGTGQWLALSGGADGVLAAGLQVVASDEGRVEVRGDGLVAVRADGKPGYIQVVVERDPAAFRSWLGAGNEPLLTIVYRDGARGSLSVQYDSADPRVKHPPYPDGVWRQPEGWSRGLALTGDGTVKTATARLPAPYFQRRCHGADLRIDASQVPGFVLLGVALTAVPMELPPDQEHSQDLRYADGAGIVAVGSGVVPRVAWVQRGTEAIAMEAELAQRLVQQDGRGLGLDPTASGGAYIHHVEDALWAFTCASPGRYVLWQRAAFPGAGNWNHSERLNDGPERVVVDHDGQPTGWTWVRSGMYDLVAGPNRLLLNYLGGARLDRLVFAAEGVDPTTADPAGSLVAQPVVVATSLPIRPFDVAGWIAARPLVCANGGSVVQEISSDQGATWIDLGLPANLSKLAVAGGGADELLVRLSLTSVPGSLPPVIGGASVVYRQGARPTRSIAGGGLKLTYDQLGVVALSDQVRGVELLRAPAPHPPLLRMLVKSPGDAPTRSLDLLAASLVGTAPAGDPASVVLRYRFPGDLRVDVTVRLRAGGQSEWSLAIDNRSDLHIAELQFPVLSGAAVSGDGSDDELVLPRTWGQVFRNPAKAWAGRGADQDWGVGMPWAALYDGKAGLYLGIEDPRRDDWTMVCAPDASGGITLQAIQRVLVPAGGSWASAVFRVAAVDGGSWHAAADLYRAYAERTMAPVVVPDHVKWNLDAWSGQDSNVLPQTGWDAIRRSGEINRKLGIAVMPANRQMLDGPDSSYCGMYPYPSIGWGSINEFSQQMEALRARGGFYLPYHNAHLWAPGYGHYQRIGAWPKTWLPKDLPMPDDAWYAKASARSYTGGYPRIETDRYNQVYMAMASPEWRAWMVDWTRRYMTYGADGMYYDQFNMIYPNGRLYDGFTTYGNWLAASMDMITRATAAARALNPWYISSGEVANDTLGQQIMLSMTSGTYSRVDLLRYCLQDRLVLDGQWNGGCNGEFGGFERTRFIWQTGTRFEHLVGDQGWTAKVLALRRAVKSLLYDAEYRDRAGIVVRAGDGAVIEPEALVARGALWGDCRGVSARWFRFSRDGQTGAVVNLVNAPAGGIGKPRKDATFRLPLATFGALPQATAFLLDGSVVTLTAVIDGDQVVVPVPAVELSSVVLATRLRPVVAWDLDGVTTPGEQLAVRLRVTNANPAAQSGSVQAVLPEGWIAPPAMPFGPLAPGASADLVIPVAVPAGSTGRQPIRCQVRSAEGAFTTWSLAVVNPPVLVEFVGDPGRYRLAFTNLSSQPAQAAIVVTAPATLRVSAAGELAIPARQTVELPVAVEGQMDLPRLAEIQATVTMSGSRLTRVRGVLPPIPNGGFEEDGAGDARPDWWMCKRDQDEYAYDGMALVEDRPHGGKRCLRLLPRPAPVPGRAGATFHRAFPVHGAVQANHRYRVSVWVRGDEPQGPALRVNGQTATAGIATNWTAMSVEVTVGASGAWELSLLNRGAKPADFDDLRVEDLGPVKR